MGLHSLCQEGVEPMPIGTSPRPVIHWQSSLRQPQVAPKITRQVAAQFQCQDVKNVILNEGPGRRAGILPVGTLSLFLRALTKQASYTLLLNFSNNYFSIFISSLGGCSWNWSDINRGNKGGFFFVCLLFEAEA